MARRDVRYALLFVLGSLAGLSALACAWRAPALTLAARLALGAAATLAWLALTLWAERALRTLLPAREHGRWAPWRHPWRGPVGRALDVLANSRLAGVLLEPLPELAMRSDIRDVIYVNYLVEAERALALVPEGLELERVGPGGRYTLLTFLTYQHGHFGFRFLGPLRKLLPSPVQSNWRVHVRDPRRGTRGIYFVTNAITSTPLALGARLTTRGMPMHVLARGAVTHSGPTALRVELDPGHGSAPDALLELEPCAAPELQGPWRECYEDWQGLLAYCVPQDRAMDAQPAWGEVSRQEIDLGIPLAACVPLAGSVRSKLASALAGDAAPLCFRVPKVRFEFSVEAHDAMGAPLS